MNNRKCICIIRTGPIEVVAKVNRLLYEHFAKVFENVIFLDVDKAFTSIIGSDASDSNKADTMLPSKFKVVRFKSLTECKTFFKTHNIVAICYFSERWCDWWLHHYLKKYAVPLVYIDTLSTVVRFKYKKHRKKTLLTRFLRKLNVMLSERFHRFIAYNILSKVDTYFVSRRDKAEKKKKDRRFSEVVLTNCSFYDNMLINNYSLLENRIVFLDSMLPYHGDQIRFGFKPINKRLYYESLDRVFGLIEKILGKEIVICLHPKYNTDSLYEDFGRRKAVKYQTDELVAQAQLVLFHESSAINSAIVYGKKIIQLTSSRFNDFIKYNCECYQKFFSVATLDIYECSEQHIKETIESLELNRQAYDAFLSNFIIASGHKGLSSCAQITDHISRKYGIIKNG